MGQPQGDFSEESTDQPHEYDHLQHQEYQHDASHAHEDFTAHTYETGCYDSTQQNQPMNPSPNDPQAQQPQPPPGQYQPPPPPVQPQQYPRQMKPGYGPQPGQPIQYPPQVNPGYVPQPGQPVQYPPRNPQNSPMYQQQSRPTQPVRFPPQSPQANPMFGPQAQAGFTPAGPQAYNQAPQAQPVPFPPQSHLRQQQAQYNIPNSPIKPNGNMAAPGFPVQPTQQVYNQAWQTGLFDCMDDPMNALITAFFPCVTFGQVAEIVDNGNTSCGTSGMLYGVIAFCIAMPCILSCGYRTKLRARFGLVESPAPDWITHFFLEWCALCQEYRELNLRGIDPSIGWQGNLAKQQMQQPHVAMVAPMNQRMMA